MSYKNTMKLFASNFSLVWKQVLYFVVCFIFFFICAYQAATPIFDMLKDEGVFTEFENVVNSLYALKGSTYLSLLDTLKHILNLIVINFKEIYLYLILLFLFAFLLPYIIFQMSIYNLSSIIYKKLSMNMNVKYIPNFISTFKSSFNYAISNVILSLPFWALKILFLEIYLHFSSNLFIRYIGMVVLSALFILLDSVKNALFASYTGSFIESNGLPIKVFGSSFSLTANNFWNLLSNSIILKLTSIVAQGFVALFTFFSGLFIVIPASFVLTSIFYIVVYFNKTGQRYYLSNNYIFNPTKYTVKQDEFAPKYLLPEEPVEQQVVETINNSNIKVNKKKNKKKKKR